MRTTIGAPDNSLKSIRRRSTDRQPISLEPTMRTTD
jgi:hypothetical protein